MKTISKILLPAVVMGLLAVPATVATTAPAEEDQPHMQQALEALKQAERHLQQAIPDKGGHRSAAIKACEAAIKDTEEGIKYESEHPDHK
jgi:type II secretory pathway component PulM